MLGDIVPKNIPLTLACGNYEIVRALLDGTVKPDGIDLTILTDMDSTTRHWRFLREGHFDVAETSCSSYIVARDKRHGDHGHSGVPASALPPRLRVHQHQQGHQEADRPDRQEDRHQVVPGHRDPLDARHPRARIRRAAQSRSNGSPSSTRTSTSRRRRTSRSRGCRTTSRSRTCWRRARSTR